MDILLHLDYETVLQLEMLACDYGQPHDALTLEVSRNGLTYRTHHWPSEILAFQGVTDMPPFESYRSELYFKPICIG